jgi:hypothetical protein
MGIFGFKVVTQAGQIAELKNKAQSTQKMEDKFHCSSFGFKNVP